MAFTQYLKAITNAQSIGELWDMHTRKMAEYGFDRLIYGFTRYRHNTSFGDPEDCIVLTNHKPSYTDVFIGEGMYFQAPMTKWVLENEGACSWNILQKMMASETLSDSERRVIDFNISQNVLAGYTISFKSISPRSKGVIGLTAQADISQQEIDNLWAEHGDDIVLMNNIAHLKIMTLPHIGTGRSLTKRQKEVLEWVGDGKTTQDIALLMGLTPATVEKHLRLAREALNVETTAQAVLKAALKNQMFIFEV